MYLFKGQRTRHNLYPIRWYLPDDPCYSTSFG